MYETQIAILRGLLEQRADSKTRDWWEGYVKNSAPFLGVKMAAIRSATHQWYDEHVVDALDAEQQVDLALALFFAEYSEEKLAGALVLQEILIPSGVIACAQWVDRFAELFVPGGIIDWNVCDWFCVKVLGPLIERDGEPCAHALAAWRHADDLWQARASLVAFVKVAGNRDFYPFIQESCHVLIRRQERFAKTAVGWILREISKYDVSFVRQVVEDLLAFFSQESLRSATKYLSKDEQRAYLQRLKDA